MKPLILVGALLVFRPAHAGTVTEIPRLQTSLDPAGGAAPGLTPVGGFPALSPTLLPLAPVGLTLAPAAASLVPLSPMIAQPLALTPQALPAALATTRGAAAAKAAAPAGNAPAASAREQLGSAAIADTIKEENRAGAFFDASRSREAGEQDEFARVNAAAFTAITATYANSFHREVNLKSPPAGYLESLRARNTPKVLLRGALSYGGSTGPVLRGETRATGADGKARTYELAIKVRHAPMRGQTWDTVVTSLREEIVAGRAMAEALPKGWAPRFFGEADIDGNPAIAMELVRGKGVDELTPAQLIDLLTERGVAQAAAGIEIMRRAGWGGIDSPQFVLLTEDQTINGVARKRGDIVFVDAGALDRDQKRGWQKPQDAAADLIFMGALAREYRKLGISTPFDDTPVSIPEKQRRELMERARKAAQAYAHPDLSKFPAGGS